MLQETETELHLTGKREKRRFKAYTHTYKTLLLRFENGTFPTLFFIVYSVLKLQKNNVYLF